MATRKPPASLGNTLLPLMRRTTRRRYTHMRRSTVAVCALPRGPRPGPYDVPIQSRLPRQPVSNPSRQAPERSETGRNSNGKCRASNENQHNCSNNLTRNGFDPIPGPAHLRAPPVRNGSRTGPDSDPIRRRTLFRHANPCWLRYGFANTLPTHDPGRTPCLEGMAPVSRQNGR